MNDLKLLISHNEILSKVSEISKILEKDYDQKEITLVMIMKGAICLVADLIRHLKIPTRLEFIQVSSYGHKGKTVGPLSISGLQNLNLHSQDVLIVDDIFDTGRTLESVVALLKKMQPKSLKSLVLLSKKVKRDTNYRPDYCLFEIENHFVVGYGLDFKEQHRGLPGIYMIQETDT